jgi:glucose/arabinose dehydrogenase
LATALSALASALAVAVWPSIQDPPALRAPEGFVVEMFADGLGSPGPMAVGPDGALYVAAVEMGRIVRLEDGDRDGRADTVATVVDGLDRPQGLAWQGRGLWIAEETRITRLEGGGSPGSSRMTVVRGLPGAGEVRRPILVERGAAPLLVAVAAACQVCVDEEGRRGVVMRYDRDGGASSVWAAGLRAVGGLAIHPETGEVWATDSGRDGLGAGLPPDEINVLRAGQHYGWPHCYGPRVPDPAHADPSRCDATEPPALLLPAGSRPYGIAFYTGDAFPDGYRGDAFVVLHGSRDAGAGPGSRVVRVRVLAGRPVSVEDFVTGWVGPDGAVGRPYDVLVGPEGALYVSDDRGGRVWRVAWRATGTASEAAGR